MTRKKKVILYMVAALLLTVCGVLAFSMVPEATAEDAVLQETTVATTVSAEPIQTLPPETEAPTTLPETQPQTTEATVPETTAVEETKPPRTYSSVPVYFQTDYPDVYFGSGTIATSGCSVTSLAMVATYLTDHTYMPDELAGYFADYIGNSMELLEHASDVLQLPWKRAENFHVALQALREGKVVIALMNAKSIFTDGQHFIVLTGLNEEGKILVNDPNENNYSLWNLKNAFANGFSSGDISHGYSGAWIYDPAAMPEEPFIYQEEEVVVECRYPGLELTEEERNLLASMVWVEAQGEPFEGQQAIAEVVLNRLVASNFQSSIRSIIYADGQFRSLSQLDTADPTHVQYEAVERALNGPYVLPIDVVFFATYAVNDNVWGKIGGHTFCYNW